MCWQSSVNNAENSMWHNRAPMFWHAIDCVAVPAYFECVYKVASIISVKEREREKIQRWGITCASWLLTCQCDKLRLPARFSWRERRKTIHPFKFHNISTKPDVSKNQLGAKDGMSRKVRNLSPVIKKFIFFPIARISDRMFSLRSWAEHVAASSQISMCFPFAFLSSFRSRQLG